MLRPGLRLLTLALVAVSLMLAISASVLGQEQQAPPPADTSAPPAPAPPALPTPPSPATPPTPPPSTPPPSTPPPPALRPLDAASLPAAAADAASAVPDVSPAGSVVPDVPPARVQPRPRPAPRAADLAAAAQAISVPAPGYPRLAAGQPVPPNELDAFVDGVVLQSMRADRLAGVSVAIVQAGRPVLEKGYGFADLDAGRPVDPATTMFRIGSITKTFTWIALMKLVEAERVRLDDPINEHLPPDLQIPDGGFSEPIRVRHLMTHTPGFEDSVLGHLFVRDAAFVRSLGAYLREERPARVREPGRLSTYSNYGASLAGAIVEQIYGVRWQEIVESQITGPLSLASTSVREPYPARTDLPMPMADALATQLAQGYRWTGTHHEPRAFEFITHNAPAGAMSSTAADMSRYMLTLLNDGTSPDGVQIFGAGTAQAFRAPMTTLPPSAGNWAGGFWMTPLPGGFTNYGHDGATLTFFSSMVLVPELQLGIFVATNTAGGGRLTSALPSRIVDHFYAPRDDDGHAGQKALIDAAPAYEGSYLPTRRAYHGLEGFVFRLLQTPVTVTPDGYLHLTMMGESQRFASADRPGEFRAVDDGFLPGVAVQIENDRVTRIESMAGALERVGPFYRIGTLGLLAGAALVAALGTLLGLRLRFGTRVVSTFGQSVAGALQTSSAAAWLIAALAFGVFLSSVASEEAEIVYVWPRLSILMFSISALMATVLSGAALVLAPRVWRVRRGVPGWTVWRKLRFTLATCVFVALGSVLGLWGALQPWNP